jgi:hypothetical protein
LQMSFNILLPLDKGMLQEGCQKNLEQYEKLYTKKKFQWCFHMYVVHRCLAPIYWNSGLKA